MNNLISGCGPSWPPSSSLALAVHRRAARAGVRLAQLQRQHVPRRAVGEAVIDFDGRGFLIHGRRTFIVAGDMHYSRIPRAQWRTRLLRIKRAGYNTIQTYAFWNFHEPQEGKFIFTGDRDLDAYLKLIHSLGMYAIVRMGPYVNAEWDTGGLPVWLRFKPGLLPMTDDAPFWAAVNPYLDKLIPIIAANQITRGGPIIMVQLENEHAQPRGGGTDICQTAITRSTWTGSCAAASSSRTSSAASTTTTTPPGTTRSTRPSAPAPGTAPSSGPAGWAATASMWTGSASWSGRRGR